MGYVGIRKLGNSSKSPQMMRIGRGRREANEGNKIQFTLPKDIASGIFQLAIGITSAGTCVPSAVTMATKDGDAVTSFHKLTESGQKEVSTTFSSTTTKARLDMLQYGFTDGHKGDVITVTLAKGGLSKENNYVAYTGYLITVG